MNEFILKKKLGIIVVVLGLLIFFLIFDPLGEDSGSRYVKQWSGKTFVFPDSVTFRKYGKDIVNYEFLSF